MIKNMKKAVKKILAIVGVGLLFATQTFSAEISYSGTVTMIRSNLSSANSGINESWSWIQVSGLTGTTGCSSGNEGVGDLAYLAFPDSEKYSGTIVLSAYLSGENIQVLIDTSNLYEGKCRIKQLSLVPAIYSAPIVYNSFDSANKAPEITLTNANATASTVVGEAPWRSAMAVSPLVAGEKYYWEGLMTKPTTVAHAQFGIASNVDLSSFLGFTSGGYSWASNGDPGKTWHNFVSIGGFDSLDGSTRVMVAFDPDAGKIWFGKNGVWDGDPGVGTGARYDGIAGMQYPGVSSANGSEVTLIFDPAQFQYTPPTGFVPSIVSQ